MPAETGPAPTRPASPSPTRSATPTRLFVGDSLLVTPSCSSSAQFLRCTDPLLQIQFEYPPAWGSLRGTLRPGETGYAYDYAFVSTSSADPAPSLQAGGRSRDFGEGRGGMLTDFGGFRPEGPKCLEPFHSLVCERVQPGVTLVFTFPSADEICQPTPISIFRPLGVVLIELPGNPAIHGFLWAAPFLSRALQAELNGLLEFSPEQVVAGKCSPQDKARYTNRAEQLAAAIPARTLDAETNANLDWLYHLAQSVVFQ